MNIGLVRMQIILQSCNPSIMRCITMTITKIEAVGAACSGTQCWASRGWGRTGQSLTLLQPSVQRVGGGLPVVETSHVGFPLPLADAAARARAGGGA